MSIFSPQEIKNQHLYVSLFLLLAVVFVFFPYFNSEQIISSITGDTASQFLAWRKFAFSEIKLGHFPLWNPHLFSGVPFFSGFQSALLYPPNLLFIFLPVSLAINLSFTIHTLLLGLLMQYWMASRRLQPFACGVAALTAMFGGAYFLHIYPGHLSNVCTMAWAPLVFWMTDKLLENSLKIKYLLLGMLAVAMQILAGHPQYFFYCMISMIIFAVFKIFQSDIKLKKIFNLMPMLIGGVLLSAVQIIGGMMSSAESLRGAGLTFEVASMQSFPLENILTAFAPTFFGDLSFYWGRFYLWETSLFVGVSAIILAAFGAWTEFKNKKTYIVLTIFALFLLALGKATPLFTFLYHYVPGFSSFRGITKFIFFIQIFVAWLVAIGADELLKNKKSLKTPAYFIFAFAIVLASLCYYVTAADWKEIITAVLSKGESYLFRDIVNDQKAVMIFQNSSFFNLFWATVSAFAVGILFYLKEKIKYAIPLVFIIATFELINFSNTSLISFDEKKLSLPPLEKISAEDKKNNRVLNLLMPNDALLQGYYDIWGSDPLVLRRYAEFMSWTQGLNPDIATQYVSFSKPHPLYKMLRLKYGLITDNQKNPQLVELPAPLPKIFLVGSYRLVKDRNEIFKTLIDPSFDLTKEVALESAPEPAPESAAGSVEVIDESSDQISLLAKLEKPSFLVITDNYAKDWKATPIEASTQLKYDVMPVNYILKGIPLAAGTHKIKLQYKPTWFVPSLIVTLISWILFFLFLALKRKTIFDSR